MHGEGGKLTHFSLYTSSCLELRALVEPDTHIYSDNNQVCTAEAETFLMRQPNEKQRQTPETKQYFITSSQRSISAPLTDQLTRSQQFLKMVPRISRDF